MISVYDRNETDFFHNGIVLSEAIQCIIEEELNGKYVLELIHPIDKRGKWEYLVEENIIKADGQLFRIYATEKTLDRIYVYARHIFYDLLHNFLEDVRPTNMNAAAALDWILSHTLYPHPFTSTSDIDTINTRYFIRTNPVDAILGPDGIAERWGGELVRDNFTIKLLKQRGSNKGAKVVYGKNLLGLEVKRDMDTVVTRIMPIGRDELLLPEKYVDSPLIDNYVYPRVREIKFDIGVDDETTEEEAYEKLRQACRELYEKDKIDIPAVNITVNLLLLENTEEYKNLKQLEKVELGDIVSCTDNPLKITFEAKVIRVKKDVIANRNVEVELGQYKKGISNTIKNAIKDISEEIRNTTSNLEKAIEDATKLLTNALGGHVLKRPGELLIMDTDDPATAKKVWRWNLNGLGYSSNGINGPYRLAMTMDGQIVADFITTGTLDANLIKTGTIKSKDGTIYANLDNNTFMLGGKSGDVVEHSNQKSVYKHEDGSYTEISSKGLYRYDAGIGREYHHMFKVIPFVDGADGPRIRWIKIGPEFNGKNWQVYLALADSMITEPLWAIHRIVVTQAVDKDGKTVQPRFRDGQWEFPVMAYKIVQHVNRDERKYGDVAGLMFVIA